MRLFILSFIIFFSSTSIAQENVCPVSDNESLDKLKESDFSKESLEKTLGDLQKLFDGKIGPRIPENSDLSLALQGFC